MCTWAQCLKKHTKKRRRWPTANITRVTSVSSRNARKTQVSKEAIKLKLEKLRKQKKE